MEAKTKYFDIAANLADERYEDDIDQVLLRAKKYGVEKLLFAGTHLKDGKKSYELSLKDPNYYCAAGIHPCRASQYIHDKMTFEEYAAEIEKLIKEAKEGKVIAVGECGLDYDRFKFASKEQQMKAFPIHFDLAHRYSLPMYLHERNTNGDFSNLVKDNRSKFSTGVVHSFTGSTELMKEIVGMDLYIGINGCSLKTQENMSTVKEVPLDKLLVETDAPFCTIRSSFPSYKFISTHFKFSKGKKAKLDENTLYRDRNEPCTVVQVLEAIAGIKQLAAETVAKAAWENSLKLFNLAA